MKRVVGWLALLAALLAPIPPAQAQSAREHCSNVEGYAIGSREYRDCLLEYGGG